MILLEDRIHDMIHLPLHLPPTRLMTPRRSPQNHAARIQHPHTNINRTIQNQRAVLRVLQLIFQNLLHTLQLLLIPDLEITVHD